MTAADAPGAGAGLRTERSGGVLRLELAAPPANLLTLDLIAALKAAVAGAAGDDGVRVVVVAASGPIFSAGHDLNQIREFRRDADGGRTRLLDLFDRSAGLMLAIGALPQPVVAEVGGLVTAAGTQLVASCDIVVAGDTARFGVNGIDVGFFCVTPMVPLTRTVGPKAALDMLMTGDLIDARRAREAGLVSRVASAGELGAATGRVVEALLARPAPVLTLGKRAWGAQNGLPLVEAYRAMNAVAVDNLMMADAGEGIAAFLEKRAPNWEKG